MIFGGKPEITLETKILKPSLDDLVFIPKGSIHRIRNRFKQPVKIIEAQIGKILKETDIIRLDDIYGRIKK